MYHIIINPIAIKNNNDNRELSTVGEHAPYKYSVIIIILI